MRTVVTTAILLLTQDAIQEAIETAGIEFIDAGASSAPAGAVERAKR